MHFLLTPGSRNIFQIDNLKLQRRRFRNDLDWLTFGSREDRAQRFMPPHDFRKAPLQRWDVERPFEAQHLRNIVDRAAADQLIEEPEPLLREGKRHALQPRVAANG